MLCGSGFARRHQQAAAQLHAAGDEQKDHQHRGSVGHCRQRIGIQPQADDHGIGHGVKLCCHHAQDNGQRVPQQRGPHCPGQQRILFVHTNTLFSQKIKPAGNLSPRPPAGSFSVAPAGVEPTMGESKSPALPLGDGAPVRISIVEFLSFVKQKRFFPVCTKCFTISIQCPCHHAIRLLIFRFIFPKSIDTTLIA